MHPPRNTGPVSYHVSQNNPGPSGALASAALQHPPCPTHGYRRHKAGAPVTARLQLEHLPPLSAACLALPPPLPARPLASVSAAKMLGVTSSILATTKLWVLSSIPKPVPPFQRTVPVDAGRPAIFNFSFPSSTQQCAPSPYTDELEISPAFQETVNVASTSVQPPPSWGISENLSFWGTRAWSG